MLAAADPRRDVSTLGDVLVQHLVEHGHEVVVLGARDVLRSRRGAVVVILLLSNKGRF